MAEETRAACLLRQSWRPERVPAATAQFLLVVRPATWKLASIGDKQPSVTVVVMTASPGMSGDTSKPLIPQDIANNTVFEMPVLGNPHVETPSSTKYVVTNKRREGLRMQRH